MERNEDLTVMIYKARLEDRENIWHLLHANCRTWTMQQIKDNISKMFILAKNGKVLGVLCGDFNPGAVVIDWVEIHPLYSEKILREVMIQGLLGTQKTDDPVNFLNKTINKQYALIWDMK